MIRKYFQTLLFLSALTFTLYPSSFLYSSTPDLGSTKIYFSSGEKLQTDNSDERDLSGDFSFYKYGTLVNANPDKGIRYKAAFKEQVKYFTNNLKTLDNISRSYSSGFSVLLHKSKANSVDLDADCSLRTKRYQNNAQLEYDLSSARSSVSLDSKELYSVKIDYGIKDYDYINNPDSSQQKFFLKFSPSVSSFDK